MKTSYTEHNFGRRFYSCPNYKIKRTFGFFAWVDPLMCDYGKRVLKRMRDMQKRLNFDINEVQILKEEVEKHKEEVQKHCVHEKKYKEEVEKHRKQVKEYKLLWQ
ncbi:hypothetical protein CJ030_MR8G008694 [Morella rubra]|uniref:GRF-type domain-containing protein n=1 Tax=Morella rubra TaxID=262757 RepID=A0A6A1UQ59_9ROSI|nr:hypothetical protein CJ030_MR8G008694 [Morella rubra]